MKQKRLILTFVSISVSWLAVIAIASQLKPEYECESLDDVIEDYFYCTKNKEIARGNCFKLAQKKFCTEK